MLKIEKTVLPSPEQWEIIIEGMRNPKNSWALSDSYTTHIADPVTLETADYAHFVGEKDMKLMNNLAKGGPVHAKYRRMIPVYATIVAPLFWWKEMDTYKIGVTRNSCSTMHKIHAIEFTIDNFTHEGIDACEELTPGLKNHFINHIQYIEFLRKKFNETKDKRYWRALIEMLPDGYNMKATLMLNYEVLVGIYKWRREHKLDEWHVFCNWIENLPYSELITGKKLDNTAEG